MAVAFLLGIPTFSALLQLVFSNGAARWVTLFFCCLDISTATRFPSGQLTLFLSPLSSLNGSLALAVSPSAYSLILAVKMSVLFCLLAYWHHRSLTSLVLCGLWLAQASSVGLLLAQDPISLIFFWSLSGVFLWLLCERSLIYMGALQLASCSLMAFFWMASTRGFATLLGFVALCAACLLRLGPLMEREPSEQGVGECWMVTSSWLCALYVFKAFILPLHFELVAPNNYATLLGAVALLLLIRAWSLPSLRNTLWSIGAAGWGLACAAVFAGGLAQSQQLFAMAGAGTALALAFGGERRAEKEHGAHVDTLQPPPLRCPNLLAFSLGALALFGAGTDWKGLSQSGPLILTGFLALLALSVYRLRAPLLVAYRIESPSARRPNWTDLGAVICLILWVGFVGGLR